MNASEEMKKIINSMTEGQLNKVMRREFNEQYKRDVLIEHYSYDETDEEYNQQNLERLKRIMK